MQLRMIAMSIGIAVVSIIPQLPTPPMLAGFILIQMSYFLVCQERFHRSLQVLLLCFSLGVGYGYFNALSLVKQLIPSASVPLFTPIIVTIRGLPKVDDSYGKQRQRFIVDVGSATEQLTAKQLLVTWLAGQTVIPGEQWQLYVKITPLRGLSNPAGFDYQQWLVSQGIDGFATVLADSDNRRIQAADLTIDHLRWRFQRYLDSVLKPYQFGGIIKALLIGDKSGITKAQWSLFAATGTTHLMVISGLHVGIIAMLGFMVGRVCSALLLPLFSLRIAALCSVIAAIAYSASAGFSLPTQRATIMIVALMLALILARPISSAYRFFLALLICLLFDPLAAISASFWLSFIAVGVILIACSGRKDKSNSAFIWLRAQWAVLIGLSPVLLFIFSQAPILASSINIIAIPLFSLLLVPLLLIAVLMSCLDDGLISHYLWLVGDQILAWLLEVLTIFAQLPTLTLHNSDSLTWVLVFGAVIVLLLPKGLPARYLAIVLLSVLLRPVGHTLKEGEYDIIVFDVGQGLAVLIKVEERYWLVDTGAGWPTGSMVESVIRPYLMAQGVSQLEGLIISHADNDHAGGVTDVLSAFAVNNIYVGEQLSHIPNRQQSCSDQHWHWHGVDFRFFDHGANQTKGLSSNNHSCVLLLSTAESSILMPGDIERLAEQQLVARYGDLLAANILVAPHHGSATSSSWPFIKAVSPQQVIFSAAFDHSFGHPNARVVKRYVTMGTQTYNTAADGAIVIRKRQGRALEMHANRANKKHFWQ